MIPIGETAYYATRWADRNGVTSWSYEAFEVLGHGKECYFYKTGEYAGGEPILWLIEDHRIFPTKEAVLEYIEGMNEYEAME